jgi:hypothetical protein
MWVFVSKHPFSLARRKVLEKEVQQTVIQWQKDSIYDLERFSKVVKMESSHQSMGLAKKRRGQMLVQSQLEENYRSLPNWTAS